MFPDVRPTMQERKKEMLELRKQLAAKNIGASVIYPAKLRVQHKDKTYIFLDVDSAKNFVKSLEGETVE